jgi:uncharacterized phage protein (TIGR02218 family)
MRDLPDLFAARLGGATTLCLCWQIAFADGTRQGFTDHDGDIIFDGITHVAASGFRPDALEQKLGLQVSTTQIAGALNLPGLDAEALAAGRLDGATITTFVVDWTKPDLHLAVDCSDIGAVERLDGAFVAHLQSPAHRLAAPVGRLFQKACDAELGDTRCGLSLALLTQPASVLAFDGDLYVTLAATGRPDGWFTHGVLCLPQGERLRIRDHRALAVGDGLALWTRPVGALAAGSAVTLVAGCDKSHAMCRDRFANVANFRGFPHIPGNDLVLAYARADDVAMDGGSLFR